MSSVGAMLKCAAEDLRRDPEVVLTAVQQDAKALMHADPELLHDGRRLKGFIKQAFKMI